MLNIHTQTPLKFSGEYGIHHATLNGLVGRFKSGKLGKTGFAKALTHLAGDKDWPNGEKRPRMPQGAAREFVGFVAAHPDFNPNMASEYITGANWDELIITTKAN